MTSEYIINAVLTIAFYFLLTRFECCRNNRGCLDLSKAPAKEHAASGIPQYEIDSIASCLLPAMRRFFESEEGRREFEVWKATKTEREGLKRKKKAG